MILVIKQKLDFLRWRLNEVLLQKETIVEDFKKKLEEFFETNLN